jgi:tetratricopeptide (TPR) repeat protein
LILTNLGLAYLKAGENARATEVFSVAHRLEPGYPLALYGLARAAAERGDSAAAAEAYWRAWRESGHDIYAVLWATAALRVHWMAAALTLLLGLGALGGTVSLLLRARRPAPPVTSSSL